MARRFIKKGELFTEDLLLKLPVGHWDQIGAAKDPHPDGNREPHGDLP